MDVNIFRLKFFSQPASEYIKKLFTEVVAERQQTGKNSDSRDLVNHLLKLKANLKLPAGSDSRKFTPENVKRYVKK